MITVSTHVLDAVTGAPAAGVRVQLRCLDDADAPLERDGVTDADGRHRFQAPLQPGTHRIRFFTGDYFQTTFYPHVDVTFAVDEDRHYHVPLLLSPFAYSTYRGS